MASRNPKRRRREGIDFDAAHFSQDLDLWVEPGDDNVRRFRSEGRLIPEGTPVPPAIASGGRE